jgi:hypothetical protein
MKTQLLCGIISIVSLFSSIGQPSVASPNCTSLFSAQREAGQTRKGLTSWLNFQLSDPANHNSENFVYMVHGFSSKDPISKLKSPDEYINSKVRVSASLVSHLKRGTYGSWGLIFKPKMASIVQVFSEDASTGTFTASEIAKLKSEPIHFSPQELLDASGATLYNEVFIEPSESSEIHVTGFFVKTIMQNEWFIDDQLRLELEQLAQKLHLPIIEISTYGG